MVAQLEGSLAGLAFSHVLLHCHNIGYMPCCVCNGSNGHLRIDAHIGIRIGYTLYLPALHLVRKPRGSLLAVQALLPSH